jgi:type VI secretion system protein ImpK
MEPVNEATAECFNALIQLRELDGPLASPDLVHSRLCGYIDGLFTKARQLNIPERDAQDIAYALVALADEIAFTKPEPLRGFWMSRPLQLQYFNENVAGEGFFQRLQGLRGTGGRANVVRVYYQCLLFGFQGKYSMRGGDLELMRVIESVRNEIERSVDIPDGLSPAGEPPDEPLVRSSQRNPFLWVSLGIFAIAIAVFIGLRISLDRQVAGVADQTTEVAP